MKKIALVLTALFAIVFLFFVIEHFRGKWGLARWKARMAAKGEPLTIAAVTTPLPPANQNGMPALKIAGSQIGLFPSKILPPAVNYAAPGKMIVVTRLASWRSDDKPSTNVTWEALGEETKSREDALKAALKALASPEFNANPDYYLGWGTPLPHLSRLRHLGWTFKAAALHRLQAGDLNEGIEFAAGGIRICAALKDEACSISHVVRFIMAREAFELTWQAAHVNDVSDAHLKALQDAWAEQDFVKPLKRALAMEHVMTSHEFHRMRNSDVSVFNWFGIPSNTRPLVVNSFFDTIVDAIEKTPDFCRDKLFTPVWKFTWSYQDELQFMRTVERGLQAWDAAVAEQSAVPLRPLGDAEYRGLGDMSSPMEPTTLRYMLSPRAGRFYPVMKKAFVAQTLRELAMTGLALRRYELRYGKPVPSLETLVPEFLPAMPRDFIDGKALKYAPTNGVMILHSIGLDLRGDAGDLRSLVWPHSASAEESENFRPQR